MKTLTFNYTFFNSKSWVTQTAIMRLLLHALHDFFFSFFCINLIFICIAREQWNGKTRHKRVWWFYPRVCNKFCNNNKKTCSIFNRCDSEKRGVKFAQKQPTHTPMSTDRSCVSYARSPHNKNRGALALANLLERIVFLSYFFLIHFLVQSCPPHTNTNARCTRSPNQSNHRIQKGELPPHILQGSVYIGNHAKRKTFNVKYLRICVACRPPGIIIAHHLPLNPPFYRSIPSSPPQPGGIHQCAALPFTYAKIFPYTAQRVCVSFRRSHRWVV